MVDFETMSWDFINESFRYYNFGEDIQKWIKLFQNNIFSIISQGWHFSNQVNIYVGADKGIQFHITYYILCVELLAIIIRNNKLSITLNDQHQSADDITVILDGTEKSF